MNTSLDLKVQNLKYHHNVILQSSLNHILPKKRRNQLTCSGISRSLCFFSEKECVNDREQKKIAKLCISSVMKLLLTQILLSAGVAATKIIIISVECSSVYKNVVSNFTSSQISAFHVWKLSRSKQILLFQFHLGF